MDLAWLIGFAIVFIYLSITFFDNFFRRINTTRFITMVHTVRCSIECDRPILQLFRFNRNTIVFCCFFGFDSLLLPISVVIVGVVYWNFASSIFIIYTSWVHWISHTWILPLCAFVFFRVFSSLSFTLSLLLLVYGICAYVRIICMYTRTGHTKILHFYSGSETTKLLCTSIKIYVVFMAGLRLLFGIYTLRWNKMLNNIYVLRLKYSFAMRFIRCICVKIIKLKINKREMLLLRSGLAIVLW